MSSHSKIHQVNLDNWSVRIAEQVASGLTIRQWCSQNNVSFHKYNYWKHLLKEQVTDSVLPDIVPVTLPSYKPYECTNRTIRTMPYHLARYLYQ